MSVRIRKMCVIALGIALYVVLSLCLQVPVFENYYLCLGYAAMAVYCCSFGPAAGMTVGALGVVLYCLVISGLRGMPGWAAGNLVIGCCLGLAFRYTAGWKSSAARTAALVIAILFSCAAGILGVKSLVEQLLYAQPFLVRAVKNSYAFVADVVMLAASLPLCVIVDKHLRSHYPDLVR